MLLLSAETVTGAPEALMVMFASGVPTASCRIHHCGTDGQLLEAVAAVPVPVKGTFRFRLPKPDGSARRACRCGVT